VEVPSGTLEDVFVISAVLSSLLSVASSVLTLQALWVSASRQTVSSVASLFSESGNNGRSTSHHSWGARARIWSAEAGHLVRGRSSEPFNDRAGLHIGRYSFSHNSQTAAAREVFKPSTDSARLLVPTQKKIFSFGFWVLLGGRHKWGCVFMAYFTRPWTLIQWDNILHQVLFGKYTIIRIFRALDWLSRISGAKIMTQKPKNGQNYTPTNTNLGCLTPRLYMAITRR